MGCMQASEAHGARWTQLLLSLHHERV